MIYLSHSKIIALCATIMFSSSHCQKNNAIELITESTPFERVSNLLKAPMQQAYVFVIAHRGDWKEAPENSLQGIKNCIDLGVDMVELDVQMTKDSVLVLMHDITVNRTTNGYGLVKDLTYEQLKAFKLLGPDGNSVSDEHIPSLEEALAYSKGKIHLFIDKGEHYLKTIHELMTTTNTLDQSLIGGTLSWTDYTQKNPAVWAQIKYMPRAGTGQPPNYIQDFKNGIDPVGYFPSCKLLFEQLPAMNAIAQSKASLVMTATLNASNCSEEDGTIWNQVLLYGANAIVTDRPRELLQFLNTANYRNYESNW